jgi:hypothetical protein
MTVIVRGTADPLSLVGAIRSEVGRWTATSGRRPPHGKYVADAIAQTPSPHPHPGFAVLALVLASIGLYG